MNIADTCGQEMGNNESSWSASVALNPDRVFNGYIIQCTSYSSSNQSVICTWAVKIKISSLNAAISCAITDLRQNSKLKSN